MTVEYLELLRDFQLSIVSVLWIFLVRRNGPWFFFRKYHVSRMSLYSLLKVCLW